ncbi:hypothetical protein CS053_08710 [Rhodanobacter glycinis]|uniref:Bacteriophage Rz lysis protein n=1 Tax=Rhodanobacter glycinis TaxID=582702 RepID=A0A5B9DWW9_9GAMM|nr:lysis system i-spanin subunit Rz [Rhodanobacter glycinis]QEE24512.1 hypothetical protein CS053_08355 [Rhodanobacter glycinis]QEE24576.1 hypothetical protein CS053_08710 [Rhodanobacter glycinis]
MFGTLTAKLITWGVVGVLITAGLLYFHHSAYLKGEAHVQAQWDAIKASQAAVAIAASEKARSTEQAQANDFAGISSNFLQATTHAYPSIADALPAAVAAGTVRLRNDCPASPAGSGVSQATARSRAADAAATQALSDRVATAVEIVRIGDAADARERQLDAQVIGLQDILKAEREP